jgi:hypothetical protein
MILAIAATGVALWLAIATGVAIGIGRAVAIADQHQAEQQDELLAALRLVA